MDIAFDNKEISLKLKRHDAQNGHHVKESNNIHSPGFI